MSDTDLRSLERAVTEGRESKEKLERAWLRHGLGWHGETLPHGRAFGPAPREQGVYVLSIPSHESGPGVFLPSLSLDFVFVPGGEVACVLCEGHGRRVPHEVDPSVRRRSGLQAVPCERCGGGPLHDGSGRVKIPPFYVGRYPVTWGEWGAFSRSIPASAQDQGSATASRLAAQGINASNANLAHRPAVNVTHEDALAFCSWAGLRLPTATEWRHAALGAPEPCPDCGGDLQRQFNNAHSTGECCSNGTVTRRYPWGNDPPSAERCASADPRYSGKSTAPVVVLCDLDPPERCIAASAHGPATTRPARPSGASWCGMQDAVGNVYQWVAAQPGETPRALGSSFKAGVVTGRGLFDADGPDDTGTCRDDVGFRVALSAAP